MASTPEPGPIQGTSCRAADRIALRRLLIALNAQSELARDTVCRLGKRAGRQQQLLPSAEAAQAVGISRAQFDLAASAIERVRKEEDDGYEDRLNDQGIQIVTLLDHDYPSSLSDLELPPPVLYVRGSLSSRPALSIVGPRHPDPWALEVARHFSRSLAQAGLSIVSGLARGVDQAAHQAAVEAPGSTIAILGCGVDIDYPRGSARLRQAIEECGAIVSEFPPGCTPRPHHFPIRNRLIAALGFATLVVQADFKSGSLITARLALDLGRDVLAAPGRPFDRKSRGSNALLMDGAQIALDPQHLLEALATPIRRQLRELAASRAEPSGQTSIDSPGAVEHEILSAVAAEAKTAEQLSGELRQSIPELLPRLMQLELTGKIRLCPGGSYIRAR